MYKTEKNLLLFKPYVFENGATPKDKFFLVLKTLGEGEDIVVTLPTSQDHVPSNLENQFGCINDDQNRINCYKIKAGEPLSSNPVFSFQKDTFIYGQTVDIINVDSLVKRYHNTKDCLEACQVKCQISDELHSAIIDCLKNSSSIKRKIKNKL